MTTINLKDLWTRTLGELPAPEQFELWLSLHKPEVVKIGVLKTAQKNLQLNRTMTLDSKIRFASKVMQSKTYDRQKVEGRNSYGAETYTRRTDQPSEDADRAVDKRGCTGGGCGRLNSSVPRAGLASSTSSSSARWSQSREDTLAREQLSCKPNAPFWTHERAPQHRESHPDSEYKPEPAIRQAMSVLVV